MSTVGAAGRLEAAGVLLGFAVLTLGLESMMKRVLARADVAAGTRKSLVAAASARRWALRS